MRLFHRTSKQKATAILRDGFKDNPNPPANNYGFKWPWWKRLFRPDRNLAFTGVWFGSVPLGPDEGAFGDVLFLLEVPDEIVCQPPCFEITEPDKGFNEYVIPAEVANRYGPPIDITDSEEDYERELPGLPRFRPEADD